ncbi:CidA/LrgA family protein [Orbaceae bacterium ac157xtp]
MKHFLAKRATMRHRYYSFYYTAFSYIRSFVILFLCLWFGEFISNLLPITIPGSIIGLLTLFFLLIFQLIPTRWIKNGCNLLMRYMMLLFIPAAMGIMDNYVYVIDSWAPIIIGCIASTFIVMLFVGWLTQSLHSRSLPEITTDEYKEEEK